MEFLGVGYQELILILVLALIFVGPERLPGIAYQIGRAVREMQKYARAVRDEFRDEFDYLEEQYKTIKGEVDETRTALKEQERQLTSELRDANAAVTAVSTELKAATTIPANGTAKPATNGTKPATTNEPQAEGDGAAKPPLVF